ncbi:MAG: phosphoribosylformylglycinamidine synthase subunit PurS [bacterium]|nr:phosphoribosylformylglycinamidine synthase subunit PurS [bacterium]
MKARVYVTLKTGVLDPQGKAVANALHSLNYPVMEVRQGKFFELELPSQPLLAAEKALGEMCEKLLANTVVENYRFEILE